MSEKDKKSVAKKETSRHIDGDRKRKEEKRKSIDKKKR